MLELPNRPTQHDAVRQMACSPAAVEPAYRTVVLGLVAILVTRFNGAKSWFPGD